MNISARIATETDLAIINRMYAAAEGEQVALREAWGVADGFPAPVQETLHEIASREDARLVVGTIDDVVVGYSWAVVEDLLPQAAGERIGVIRMIYVDEPARMVGVGEAMLASVMAWFDERGIARFDAIVSPGHRLAKNFFESAGFKARRITMYRRDA